MYVGGSVSKDTILARPSNCDQCHLPIMGLLMMIKLATLSQESLAPTWRPFTPA